MALSAPLQPPGRAFEASGNASPREMVTPSKEGQDPAYRVALRPSSSIAMRCRGNDGNPQPPCGHSEQPFMFAFCLPHPWCYFSTIIPQVGDFLPRGLARACAYLYKNKGMEFVYVVPRKTLLGDQEIHGLLPLAPAELEERFLAPAREEGFFIERSWVETHPEFKQPIPYVAVMHGEELFCLTRLQTQGEKRLHGKRSIGVGGHINPCDHPENGGELFTNACHRELHEELLLPDAPLPLTPLGILNDDRTDVGSVHLGLVFRLDASEFEVAVRETDAMVGEFEPLDSLTSLASGPESPFETWSSLLLASGALKGSATSVS